MHLPLCWRPERRPRPQTPAGSSVRTGGRAEREEDGDAATAAVVIVILIVVVVVIVGVVVVVAMLPVVGTSRPWTVSSPSPVMMRLPLAARSEVDSIPDRNEGSISTTTAATTDTGCTMCQTGEQGQSVHTTQRIVLARSG